MKPFVEAQMTDPLVDPMSVLQWQAAVVSKSDFAAASAEFATCLAAGFGFDRVSVGFVVGGASQVFAVSHGAAVGPEQDINRLVAAAMDEAIDQEATIAMTPLVPGQPRITLAHAELARKTGRAVFSVPIAYKDVFGGAVTFERSPGAPLTAQEVAICEQVTGSIGPLLLLRRDSERSWWNHTREIVRQFLSTLFGPGAVRVKLIAAVVPVACVVFLFLPLPYHVSAKARLEGSIQRAVVAPTDSFVQQVSVRPGDAVTAGQVLVEMAQQDLLLERSKWESELAQHENAYGAALAQYDRSALMLNQAKVAEARAQLDLVEMQLERSVITAPFDGIVISGDISQSVGVPVQRGQVLMVIAPRDRYRLIIEVDERDIPDVVKGAGGRLTLTAMPGDALPFSTERISPVAVTRDGQHFFEVEGKMQASDKPLRPGLLGFAKIDAGTRPIAWSMGHRLFTWMQLLVWKWTR